MFLSVSQFGDRADTVVLVEAGPFQGQKFNIPVPDTAKDEITLIFTLSGPDAHSFSPPQPCVIPVLQQDKLLALPQLPKPPTLFVLQRVPVLLRLAPSAPVSSFAGLDAVLTVRMSVDPPSAGKLDSETTTWTVGSNLAMPIGFTAGALVQKAPRILFALSGECGTQFEPPPPLQLPNVQLQNTFKLSGSVGEINKQSTMSLTPSALVVQVGARLAFFDLDEKGHPLDAEHAGVFDPQVGIWTSGQMQPLQFSYTPRVSNTAIAWKVQDAAGQRSSAQFVSHPAT